MLREVNFLLYDSHTHSIYSFDGHHSPLEMCAGAESAGAAAFVITDHCDIDGVLDGFYPVYDMDSARRAVEEANEAYAGRVRVWRGIELGEPSLRPEESADLLRRGNFDFVIASCHNLANVPDFYFFDYTAMPMALAQDLYRRMLKELCGHAAFPGIHTVAHLSYPLRYMAKAGKKMDLDFFEADFRRLFSVMRENGAALELNTKGLWTGGIDADTERFILRLWYDCGGRDVTIGSDAHRATELCRGFDEGISLLRECGFDHIVFPTERGIGSVSLQ